MAVAYLLTSTDKQEKGSSLIIAAQLFNLMNRETVDRHTFSGFFAQVVDSVFDYSHKLEPLNMARVKYLSRKTSRWKNSLALSSKLIMR